MKFVIALLITLFATAAIAEDIPIFKGTVAHLYDTTYFLDACEWEGFIDCPEVTPEELGVSNLDMVMWATHGTTIYVYGKFDEDTDACYRDIIDVKVTDPCLTPISDETYSWGTIKGVYQ